MGVGGVLDLHARQQAELDRLLGDREGAGDHRLARDHRGDGGEQHERQQGPVRGEQEERVGQRLRMLEHEGALTQIVQRQRREDEADPGGLDRRAAEMAHVGVERLGAGDGEKHAAEHDEADAAMVDEEAERMVRAERGEHAQIVAEVDAGPGPP